MRSLPMLGPRAQWQRYASVLYLTTGIHSLFDNKHSSSQAVFCAGWERSSTTQVRGSNSQKQRFLLTARFPRSTFRCSGYHK